MTVRLTGRDLLAEVVAVARGRERMELAEEALAAMARGERPRRQCRRAGRTSLRAHHRARRAEEYGSANGRLRLQLAADRRESRRVRAARAARCGPRGDARVRQPDGRGHDVHPAHPGRAPRAGAQRRRAAGGAARGSIGASDLAPMADLATAVFAGTDLAPGEGLALMNSSAFGTGLAALALSDAARLPDAADVAAALCLEGFAANLSVLHPAIERARPDPVLARTLARLRELLDGQLPLGRRCGPEPAGPAELPQHGSDPGGRASRAGYADSLAGGRAQRGAGEPAGLGGGRDAPLDVRLRDRGRLRRARLRPDRARSMLSRASERSVKLLDTPWSGLPTGLPAAGQPRPRAQYPGDHRPVARRGGGQLAQPVSSHVTSTPARRASRTAPRTSRSRRAAGGAGRAGEGIVAIELLAAAQAVDLRGSARWVAARKGV